MYKVLVKTQKKNTNYPIKKLTKGGNRQLKGKSNVNGPQTDKNVLSLSHIKRNIH